MAIDRRTGDRRSFEAVGVVGTAIAVGFVVSAGLAACGTTDEASRMTLPPLETTTTTTTTTTTIPFERFYEIKPGDSLSAIAAAKGVRVVDILNANPQLQGEDSIQAGQTIEIPPSNAVPAEEPAAETESVPGSDPES